MLLLLLNCACILAFVDVIIVVTSSTLFLMQVYKVSQSGQETEETRLSDTLVNYSNDAQVKNDFTAY